MQTKSKSSLNKMVINSFYILYYLSRNKNEIFVVTFLIFQNVKGYQFLYLRGENNFTKIITHNVRIMLLNIYWGIQIIYITIMNVNAQQTCQIGSWIINSVTFEK